MTRPSPDCRDGKHRACTGQGWDDDADTATWCPCRCHDGTPLDLVGEFRGRCGFCGDPDARHRTYDAIRERIATGDAIDDVAADYGLDAGVVAVLVGEGS